MSKQPNHEPWQRPEEEEELILRHPPLTAGLDPSPPEPEGGYQLRDPAEPSEGEE